MRVEIGQQTVATAANNGYTCVTKGKYLGRESQSDSRLLKSRYVLALQQTNDLDSGCKTRTKRKDRDRRRPSSTVGQRNQNSAHSDAELRFLTQLSLARQPPKPSSLSPQSQTKNPLIGSYRTLTSDSIYILHPRSNKDHQIS